MENWWSRNEYAATWIQTAIMLIALIPISAFVFFTYEGYFTYSIIIPNDIPCSVSIANQTLYDDVLNQLCNQSQDADVIIPLSHNLLVPSVFTIGNTTNATYVGFLFIRQGGNCYIQTIYFD